MTGIGRISIGAVTFLNIFFAFEQLHAKDVVEQHGRYEINWTTSKVRFYGVGKWADGDDSFRTAEQRAWSDGLNKVERKLPRIIESQLGLKNLSPIEKFTKLAGHTNSVSTSYFGDKRVKVVLELPLSKVVSQLNLATEMSVDPQMNPSAEKKPVTIRVSGPFEPVICPQIVDENNRTLLDGRELFSAIKRGGGIQRFQRDSGGKQEASEIGQKKLAISSLAQGPGVLRVPAGSFTNEVRAAILSGAAVFSLE